VGGGGFFPPPPGTNPFSPALFLNVKRRKDVWRNTYIASLVGFSFHSNNGRPLHRLAYGYLFLHFCPWVHKICNSPPPLPHYLYQHTHTNINFIPMSDIGLELGFCTGWTSMCLYRCRHAHSYTQLQRLKFGVHHFHAFSFSHFRGWMACLAKPCISGCRYIWFSIWTLLVTYIHSLDGYVW